MGGTAIVLAVMLAGGPGSAAPRTSAAGRLGSAQSFSWCGGALSVDLDLWADGTGIPAVYGWSYLYYNSHAAALRVDRGAIWSTNQATGTAALVTISFAADVPMALGQIVQEVPGIARITTLVAGIEHSGCCSLATSSTIENLDAVPHSFEWRWFHDTAFEEYRVCPPPGSDPDVDGGEVCLPGETPGVSCRTLEFDGLASGAVGCGASIGFHSSDTGLLGPVYVIDDSVNRPETLEVIVWEDLAVEPGLAWSGLVDGEPIAGCDGDNSILAVWRVPQGSGTLPPGGSGSLAWRIGRGCAPACCALTADAGVPQSVCQGQSVVLGGNPAARSGTPPFSYRWLPDDGTLSDPTAANPLARPASSNIYSLEVRDGAGCVASESVVVEVVPDLPPGSAGNTLWLLRAAGGAELTWVPSAGAATHTVRGTDEKTFSVPVADLQGLRSNTTSLAIAQAPIRFLRVVGVSCGGREGP